MEPARKRQLLAQSELLRDMPAGEIEALAASATWRTYRRGQQVFDQESDNKDVFFVAEGRVRVTIFSSTGREVSFRDLPAGASFGELSAIDGQPRSASVVALSPAVLASLPRDRFWALLRRQHGVTERLLKNLATLVRNLSERVVDYGTLPVQNRIQAELVRMAREAGVQKNRAVLAPVPRHADIASRVATNREAVARELSRLARAGILERDRSGLVVNDVAALSAMIEKVREN
ncbi:MAG: Crp/Fnr family transcriptional regulator [Alphaproteobacteria bacterium]|nr:Crp/Fnr family transcriptional regulator [Alphaproteobacteria bacterium]